MRKKNAEQNRYEIIDPLKLKYRYLFIMKLKVIKYLRDSIYYLTPCLRSLGLFIRFLVFTFYFHNIILLCNLFSLSNQSTIHYSSNSSI